MPGRNNNLLNLNAALEDWITSQGLIVVFAPPRSKYGGTLIPEFDAWLILNDRKITVDGASSIIAADMYEYDTCMYTREQVRCGLNRWIWDQYLQKQPYDALLLAIPRMEIRRPVGRPRKDGTNRTIVYNVMKVENLNVAAAPELVLEADPINTST